MLHNGARRPVHRPGISTRAASSSRIRVFARRKLGLAFDFGMDEQEHHLFLCISGSSSYFQNSDMEAKGKPGPEELALLEPLRGKVAADEVFGDVYLPPVSGWLGQRPPIASPRANDLLGSPPAASGTQAAS